MAPSRITWKEHVAIENNPNSVYNINDFKRPKKKFRLKLPRGYSPGDNVSKEEAKKIIRFATMKLDWELLSHLLADRRFVKTHLSLQQVEIIVGRALISGHTKHVKKFFKKASALDKYKGLSVTDAFFDDLVARKKKSISKYNGLVLMTVIRQGDHEAVKFCLEHLSPEINLHEVKVQDGDMTYSIWARHREFHELTPAEKLAEVIPKEKIFDSYFEQETPLTAVLRNRESMQSVSSTEKESMLQLLLRHGANPFAENYQCFKVAAKLGLGDEINIMLKHMKPTSNNPKARQNFSKHLKDIYTNMLAYSATENQKVIMFFVYLKVDKVKKARNDKTTNNRKLQIGTYIENAVQKLVRHGASEHCSFRYRILNGIFNLMRLKNKIETDEAKKIREKESSALEFPKTEPEPKKDNSLNDWKKSATSSLRVNEVVDYNAAFKELIADTSLKGMGAVYNRAFNINLATQMLNVVDGGSSVRSGRSYSTTSTLSRSGRSKKRTLVKPNMMYKWLLYILQKNDYNGEKMGLVLFKLGLRPYIGKPPKKKKNSGSGQSENGSAWGMESTADSVIEDDAEDADAISEKTDGSEGAGWGLGSRKPSKTKRRRSTLTDVALFFKEFAHNVNNKIKNKDKISSKEKVLILEAAAEFGSHVIMQELLLLIAPELNSTLLKCCYLATIGEKAVTQKLLVDRVTKEVEKVLKCDDSDEDDEPKKGRLTKSVLNISTKSIRNRSNATIESYLAAFSDYRDKVEAINDLNRKKDALKNRNKLRVGQSKSAFSSTRKSISAIGNSARRLSQGAVDYVKSKFGKKPSTSAPKQKNTEKMWRRTFRKSFSQSTRGRKKKNDLKEKLKKGKSHTTLALNRPTGANELHKRALNNKKNEFNAKGKKSLFGSAENLENVMADFLVGLVRAACLYGSFDCAENTLQNPFARKEDCKAVIVNSLREYCGVRMKRKKDAERYLNGYISLLTNHMTTKEANVPQIARDVIDEATKADTANLNNFTFVLNKLSEVYGKKFLTLEDLMFCIERSAETNKEWELWPDFLRLVYMNLSDDESANIERLHKFLKKKKLRSKLTGAVKRAVDHMTNHYQDDTEGLQHRKSMKDMLSNARRSLSRRRRGSRDRI